MEVLEEVGGNSVVGGIGGMLGGRWGRERGACGVLYTLGFMGFTCTGAGEASFRNTG